MENEKQSLWKRFKNFIKKVIPGKKTIAIGAAAASMMGATMDKADAATIQSDAPNKSAITDAVKNVKTNPIDLNNLRVNASDLQPNTTTEKSDLENFAVSVKSVRNTFDTVKTGIGSIEKTASSIDSLGKSSSIENAISNTENTVKSVETSTEKVNASNESVSQLLKIRQARQKMAEEKGYPDAAKAMQYNIDNLEKQKTVEKSENQYKEIKNNSKNDKTVIVSNQPHRVNPKNPILTKIHNDDEYIQVDAEETALSNQILDLKVSGDTGSPELKEMEAKRKALSELKIAYYNSRNDRNLVSASDKTNYTAKEVLELTNYINLDSNLKSGQKILELSKGNLRLKMEMSRCKDPETLKIFKETYNKAKTLQAELDAKYRENPNSPEFELKDAPSYPKYSKKELKSDVKTKKVEKTSPYLVNDPDINVDEIVGEILGTDAISNSTEKAKVTETKIDESKLADVSVGQMGVFDEKVDKENLSAKSTIDESKLADVSVGQMGVFDDLDEIIDEAIKQENQASTFKAENQVNVKTAKTVDNVKTNSNKEENKSTVNNTKVDNYKANGEKIDIDEIFKDWGILDKVQPIKNDKEKSKDDDMER